MSNFYDKLFGFFNNNKSDSNSSETVDFTQDPEYLASLEDMIDVSWAGYFTK